MNGRNRHRGLPKEEALRGLFLRFDYPEDGFRYVTLPDRFGQLPECLRYGIGRHEDFRARFGVRLAEIRRVEPLRRFGMGVEIVAILKKRFHKTQEILDFSGVRTVLFLIEIPEERPSGKHRLYRAVLAPDDVGGKRGEDSGVFVEPQKGQGQLLQDTGLNRTCR